MLTTQALAEYLWRYMLSVLSPAIDSAGARFIHIMAKIILKFLKNNMKLYVFRTRNLFFAVTMMVIHAFTSGAVAHEKPNHVHKRFLLLYSAHNTLPANMEATVGVSSVFESTAPNDYDVYAEYRDARRFPGQEFDQKFAESILAKYRNVTLDVIMAFGLPALQFSIKHQNEFAPNVPVIFGGVDVQSIQKLSLSGNFSGAVGAYEIGGTLALARALQPDAKRVVIFTGSAEFDNWWKLRAQEQLRKVDDIEISFVSDLTLEEFQSFAARLAHDNILIVLTIFEDAAGRTLMPANAAELIAARSSAPVYGVYSTYMGRGVVGGQVETFEAIGKTMAELALHIVEGNSKTPTIMTVPTRAVLDWRQMERLGLDTKLLPADTELLNYDLSPWERYKLQILLAAAIILGQTGTIAALVIQDRRRRIAEREVASRRLELAHVWRVAQIGELSGALAHELNQPLSSILANAEAGSQFLLRNPPDMNEIAAILADIAEDDRRAAGIISDLRQMMTKGEAEFKLVDLNKIVATTIRIMRSELIVRKVKVDEKVHRNELFVRGNSTQLEQVLLNLMLNAADSMSEQLAEARLMVIQTSLRKDGWRELSVSDNGQGLSADIRENPFRPFMTTKSQGLGLGLSICQTIAQSHGATLAFDDGIKQGARIVLALPPP
ncbi:signal transduction histidine kinase [Skermanella aerolata]|uniref:sensor histidine kinase n=1 Tax=Skermanella aerolata TaxID=393310 RepID=UPI003D1B2DB8